MAPEQDPEQRETCEMQIPASFADGKLMISFEEFAKIFGMKWQYEEETQTVTLTDGEKEDVSQESEAEDTGSAQVNIYEQYRKLIVEYEEMCIRDSSYMARLQMLWPVSCPFR